jgi:hypothetical protein
VGRMTTQVIVLAFTETAPTSKRIQAAGVAGEERSKSPLFARRKICRLVRFQRAPV